MFTSYDGGLIYDKAATAKVNGPEFTRGFLGYQVFRVPGSTYVSVPYLLPILILTALAIRFHRKHMTDPGLCPKCGYDTRANPDRCSECGHVMTKTA